MTRQALASFNDYWLSDPSLPQDYAQLGMMRASEEELLHLCASCTIAKGGSAHFASLNVSNCDGAGIALAVRVRLRDARAKPAEAHRRPASIGATSRPPASLDTISLGLTSVVAIVGEV